MRRYGPTPVLVATAALFGVWSAWAGPEYEVLSLHTGERVDAALIESKLADFKVREDGAFRRFTRTDINLESGYLIRDTVVAGAATLDDPRVVSVSRLGLLTQGVQQDQWLVERVSRFGEPTARDTLPGWVETASDSFYGWFDRAMERLGVIAPAHDDQSDTSAHEPVTENLSVFHWGDHDDDRCQGVCYAFAVGEPVRGIGVTQVNEQLVNTELQRAQQAAYAGLSTDETSSPF